VVERRHPGCFHVTPADGDLAYRVPPSPGEEEKLDVVGEAVQTLLERQPPGQLAGK